MHYTTLRWLLMLILAATLGLAGCGGSDSDGNTDNAGEADDGGNSDTGTEGDDSGDEDSAGGDETGDPGSGGSDDADTAPPDDDGGNGTAAGNLEYYRGSLHAVVPGSAASSVVVDERAAEADGAGIGPITLVGGTWNNGEIERLHADSVLYARQDGTLWRATTDASGGVPPAPERVSSEGGAAPLCDAQTGVDFDDADNAHLAYAIDAGGGDCSGALEWFVARVGDGSGAQPQPLPGNPVTPLIDYRDGSHEGFLVVAQQELVRTAADGSSSSIAGVSVSSFANSLAALRGGIHLLNVDGELLAYDQSTDAVTPLGHSFSAAQLPGGSGIPGARSGPARFTTDGDELFWVANTGGLYRTDIAAGTVIVLDDPDDVADQFGLGSITSLLAVGTNEVAYSYLRDPDPANVGDEVTAIRVVDKTAAAAGGATDLDTLDWATTVQAPLVQNTGEWIHYNELVIDGGDPRPIAIAARLDGSDEHRFNDALWIGAGVASLSGVATTQSPLDRVYRLDSLATVDDTHGGKTLVSVPAEEPGSGAINLGSVPTDVDFLAPLLGFGPGRLASGLRSEGGSDVLYFDETQPGSLQRVTDTEAVDETPLPFF